MTDLKTPAVEPRGPLSEAERACFDLMANGGGYMSPSNAACTALDLDTALRATLKERDEARHTADTLRAKLEIAREGLRKYAAEESYSSYQPLSCGCCSVDKEPEVMLDRGGTARATLAKLEEKS